MGQGVTDPAEILTKMNAQGINTTAADVTKALTDFATSAGLTNAKELTGDAKNFSVLQSEGLLPASVAALPKGQQLQAYIQTVHTAAKVPTAPKVVTSASGHATTAPATGASNSSWLADFYGSGGAVNLPALGMGTAAATEKMAILNGIAQRAQTLGISGGQMAAIMSDKKSAQAELTNLSKTQGQMTVNETTASSNFDQVLQQMNTLPPKTFNTFLNSFIQTGAIQAGNPNIQPFADLLTTTLNEYGKVITGQTGGSAMSDAARKEAQGMLSVAANPQTFRNFVSTAKQEMGNRVSAYATAKDSIFNLIQDPQGETGKIASSPETQTLNQLTGASSTATTQLDSLLQQYGIH